MVDAADLKSASREGVWVRVPPSAVICSPSAPKQSILAGNQPGPYVCGAAAACVPPLLLFGYVTIADGL